MMAVPQLWEKWKLIKSKLVDSQLYHSMSSKLYSPTNFQPKVRQKLKESVPDLAGLAYELWDLMSTERKRVYFLFYFLKTVCHHNDIMTFDISHASWRQKLGLHYPPCMHMYSRICFIVGQRQWFAHTRRYTHRKGRQWWNLSVMLRAHSYKRTDRCQTHLKTDYRPYFRPD